MGKLLTLQRKLEGITKGIVTDLTMPKPHEVRRHEINIGERVPLEILDNRSKHPGGLQFLREMLAIQVDPYGKVLHAGLTLGNLTPDEGENEILEMLVGDATAGTLYMNLYNVPAGSYSETDTYQADVTLVSGTGYPPAAATLTKDTDWTVTGNSAVTVAVTFTAGAADWNTAYGVIICTAATTASGFVLWEKEFTSSRSLGNGESLQVTFTAQLSLEV
jgi:hypothetical protein